MPPTTCKESCWFGNKCPVIVNLNSGAKLASLSQKFIFAANNFDRIANQAALLYRVRDELLNTSAEGRRYITLYYAHSAEIAAIMDAHVDLAEQGMNVIDALTPNLQALLDGQGNSVTITAEQVQQTQAFLDALLPYASPTLQQTITDERARRPLEEMTDKTMSQAWNSLNGYQLAWLPPINTANPYSAQQGRVIPVEFTLADKDGSFVEDLSVTVRVVDSSGKVVIAPVGISNNPTQGVNIQGRPQGAAPKYHYNLDTSGLPQGIYTLQVLYNSSPPQTPASWQITIVGKK